MHFPLGLPMPSCSNRPCKWANAIVHSPIKSETVMKNYFLPAAVVAAFAAAVMCNAAESPQRTPSGGPAAEKSSSNAKTPRIPTEIRIRSSVGDVLFRHEMHVRDLSVKCVDCHHQINARQLSTPHPDYFSSSWINCKTCHDEAGKSSEKTYVCSNCHQTMPKNIADETLSAKVVVHKQCWKCHAIGTGKEASSACNKCHSGKRRP